MTIQKMVLNFRCYLFFFCFFVASWCTGCSPIAAIELFNNTGAPLIVNNCKQLVAIAPGAAIEITPLQCPDRIQIDAAGNLWRYLFRLPSHNLGETGYSYYHSRGFFDQVTVRLQINADKKVFVLPSDADFPVKDDIPQPDGFPWQPIPTSS